MGVRKGARQRSTFNQKDAKI